MLRSDGTNEPRPSHLIPRPCRSFLFKMSRRITIEHGMWEQDMHGDDDGGRWIHRLTGQQVILTGALEQDGKPWIHFSTCFPHRVPDWDELRRTKDIFLGDVYAYLVLPVKAKYVNIHPHVLHLWVCLAGEQPLPDFTRGGNSI